MQANRVETAATRPAHRIGAVRDGEVGWLQDSDCFPDGIRFEILAHGEMLRKCGSSQDDSNPGHDELTMWVRKTRQIACGGARA